MSKILEINNCMDCPHHKVMADPDPYDSFCDDDEKVICEKASTADEPKCITVACRPYNKRKECEIPDWCPLDSKKNIEKESLEKTVD